MLINYCTKLSKTQFLLWPINIRLDEDVFRCLDQDVYIHLSHTSKTNMFVLVIRVQDVFKTSSRRLQNVFNRYHQVKLFFLTCLRGVSNTFLRRTAKMDLSRSNFWENSAKFARVTNVYRALVFHFTTLFSGLLQRRIKKLVEHLQWSFFTKILNGFKLFTIFAKKAPSQILNWVENSP